MKKRALGMALLLAAAAACTAGCAPAEEARTDYFIAAEYFPETRTLEADMTVRVCNTGEEAYDVLPFALYANAYREGAADKAVSDLYAPSAYYAGESYGGFTLLGGEGAAFSVGGTDENLLYARLSAPLFPGETAELDMTFRVTLAAVEHRLGAGKNTVNLSYFYPQLCARGETGWLEYACSPIGDPFVFPCADYTVELTLPAGWEAASAGEISSVTQNGKTTYHVVSENVRDCAFVLGKEKHTLTRTEGGVTVECCAFGSEPSEDALVVAAESLAWYGRTFGAYQKTRYVVVQTDLAEGGMEYSGMAMYASSLHREALMQAVAHETAHQWWYASVGSDQTAHAWMDEGLAEYSAALFFQACPQFGISGTDMVAGAESAYRAYFSVSAQLGGADTRMDRPLREYSGEYEYENIAYRKGMLLFDRLKSYLGDKRFFEGLSRYAGEYAGGIASPDALAGCFRGAPEAGPLIRSFTEGKCVI